MKEYYKNPLTINVNNKLLDLSILLSHFLSKYNTNDISVNKTNNLKLTYLWFLENNIYMDKVPFIKTKTLEEISRFHCEEISSFLKENIKYILPFDIPIIYLNKPFDYGEFIPIYVGKNLENSKLIFTEFRLSSNFTPITPLIYGHEITHSIIENNTISINNYINYDIIPLLIEMLIAKDIDKSKITLKTDILLRLTNLKTYIELLYKEDIPNLIKVRLSNYINSILILFEILKVYTKEKETLLKEINKIFKNENNIETLIKEKSITFESGVDNMLKLLKEDI